MAVASPYRCKSDAGSPPSLQHVSAQCGSSSSNFGDVSETSTSFFSRSPMYFSSRPHRPILELWGGELDHQSVMFSTTWAQTSRQRQAPDDGERAKGESSTENSRASRVVLKYTPPATGEQRITSGASASPSARSPASTAPLTFASPPLFSSQLLFPFLLHPHTSHPSTSFKPWELCTCSAFCASSQLL